MAEETRELPVLFRPEMVLRLLDDTKTQTRRPAKWEGPKGYPHDWSRADVDYPIKGHPRICVPFRHPDDDDPEFEWGSRYPCRPRYYPTDVLWVKERTRVLECRNTCHDCPGADYETEIRIRYEADGEERWVPFPERLKSDPDALFGKCLPSGGYREASRIILRVTDVRAQRVQEISEEDAMAEGVTLPDCTYSLEHGIVRPCRKNSCPQHGRPDRYALAFSKLWDSIHARKPGLRWADSPWVFAYTLERVKERP